MFIPIEKINFRQDDKAVIKHDTPTISKITIQKVIIEKNPRTKVIFIYLYGNKNGITQTNLKIEKRTHEQTCNLTTYKSQKS